MKYKIKAAILSAVLILLMGMTPRDLVKENRRDPSPNKKALDIPSHGKPIYAPSVKKPKVGALKQRWITVMQENFESGVMPAGWTVIDGNGDGYTWTVGVSDDPYYPPDYGTAYLYFSDDDAGSGAPPSRDTVKTVSYPVRGYSDLRFIYAYDFQEFGTVAPYEYGEIWARSFSSGAWGPWQILVQYNADIGPNYDTLYLGSFLPADSVQLMFVYWDEGDWGWGFYLDNFLLEGFLPPHVMFVDDDEGMNFDTFFVNSLSFLGVNIDSIYVVAPSGNGPDSATMSGFDIVIWNTGDDWLNTLTSTDTLEIKKYLNAGGRLWLSSQDVLYDIGKVSWMHIDAFASDVGCSTATGVGPVMGGFNFATSGGAITDFSDLIVPDSLAWSEVVNQNGDTNTVAIDPSRGVPYYLFFNTFPFENINDEYNRHEFARRVLRFLGYPMPSRDVGIIAIQSPFGFYQINDTASVIGVFANLGSLFPETFTAHMEVLDPSSNVIFAKDSVITLNPYSVEMIDFGQVTFDTTGVYSVFGYVVSNFDENAGNNTLYGTANVIPWSSWTEYQKPGVNPHRLTHATVYDFDNDKIYMIGGTPDGTSGSNVSFNYRYDPLNDTWETNLAPMPTPRGWIQGAYWDGFIYVAGGYSNSGTALNVFEAYDIENNQWITLTPLPSARVAHGTVAWNGSVYVIGGVDASFNATNTVFRYDINSGSWSPATSLPDFFYMGGVTHRKDTIFIVGGYNGSGCWSSLWMGVIDPTNPNSITWTNLGPLPYPNMNNAAAALPGSIVMVGGFIDALYVTNAVWEYNISSGTWMEMPSYVVPIVRNHFAIGRQARGGTGDRIYVVAGDADGDWDIPNDNYYYIERAAAISVSEKGGKDLKPIFTVKQNIVKGNIAIHFALTEKTNVDISLYNVLGQKVATIVKGVKEKGEYTVNYRGRDLRPGVYFVKMKGVKEFPVQRVIIVK